MPAHDAASRLRDGVPALTPLAWLYRAGLAVSRAAGLARRAERVEGGRVVSVGNLEAGGSGKTPFAIDLLERAARAGERTAYVSRGYGSAASGRMVVTVVPSAGGAFPGGLPAVRVVDRAHPVLEAVIGDEGALAAARLPESAIVVARDKEAAARAAIRMGASLVVVDDAFQSWRLARDVDVVLLDAERPLGSGRLLPAGTLREPPAALRRADVVVFNGVRGRREVDSARERVTRWLRPGAVILGLERSVELVPSTGGGGRPERVFLASGIARPERFRDDVAAAGYACAGELRYRDHHVYTQREADEIDVAARAAGAGAIAVTEKDWVKLRRFVWKTPVWVARLRVQVVGGAFEPWLHGEK